MSLMVWSPVLMVADVQELAGILFTNDARASACVADFPMLVLLFLFDRISLSRSPGVILGLNWPLRPLVGHTMSSGLMKVEISEVGVHSPFGLRVRLVFFAGVRSGRS
jgi:hypothetical protein